MALSSVRHRSTSLTGPSPAAVNARTYTSAEKKARVQACGWVHTEYMNVSKTVQRKVPTSAMVFVRVCDKSMHGCACCECAHTEGRGNGGEGDVAE